MATFLELFQRGDAPASPVGRTLGFSCAALEVGRATFTMLGEPERHANPMGTLHGGVLAALADAAMGYAYASTLEADESFTTLEMKMNYLRPRCPGRRSRIHPRCRPALAHTSGPRGVAVRAKRSAVRTRDRTTSSRTRGR